MALVMSTGDDNPVIKLLKPITGWAYVNFPEVKNKEMLSRKTCTGRSIFFLIEPGFIRRRATNSMPKWKGRL